MGREEIEIELFRCEIAAEKRVNVSDLDKSGPVGIEETLGQMIDADPSRWAQRALGHTNTRLRDAVPAVTRRPTAKTDRPQQQQKKKPKSKNEIHHRIKATESNKEEETPKTPLHLPETVRRPCSNGQEWRRRWLLI